jgi:hypothetical protein
MIKNIFGSTPSELDIMCRPNDPFALMGPYPHRLPSDEIPMNLNMKRIAVIAALESALAAEKAKATKAEKDVKADKAAWDTFRRQLRQAAKKTLRTIEPDKIDWDIRESSKTHVKVVDIRVRIELDPPIETPNRLPENYCRPENHARIVNDLERQIRILKMSTDETIEGKFLKGFEQYL